MHTLYINGKFLAQPITGVQRFARQVVYGMDGLLASGAWTSEFDFVLLVPAGQAQAMPQLKRVRVRELPAMPLHLWEQFALPWFTRGATVLNLSGSAPILKRQQLCTFHDAAVFDVPSAYSKNFVRWYRFLFRVQARLSCRLITVSEFSRQRLSQNLGVGCERIGVVPNGVDHIWGITPDVSVLGQLGLTRGSYLLAVGSANPAKNLANLKVAFSALDDQPEARLVIVGGSNTAVFASDSVAPELSDVRIIQAGRVDDAQLKALYMHARAFVFPSLYEGFGIPPLEAMACGCPVLASNAASVPETCGEAAGYFDPTSSESIRQALRRALLDDIWLEELSALGRARVAQFTWQRAAQQLLVELEQLGIVQSK